MLDPTRLFENFGVPVCRHLGDLLCSTPSMLKPIGTPGAPTPGASTPGASTLVDLTAARLPPKHLFYRRPVHSFLLCSDCNDECRWGVPVRYYLDRFALLRAILRAALGASQERGLRSLLRSLGQEDRS